MEQQMMDEIIGQGKKAVKELIEKAGLKKGALIVIGCSSSEITGHTIGSFSSEEVAESLVNAIYPIIKEAGCYLAAQCCEHLNRALIIEREVADKKGYEPVNVVPVKKAGGSFATTVYKIMDEPVAVERIKADAGMDIGDTLIGMHLKEVAVPLRIDVQMIGKARVVCARTRLKFIGGVRANYDDRLL